MRHNYYISGALLNVNDGEILNTFERLETGGYPRIDMCE